MSATIRNLQGVIGDALDVRRQGSGVEPNRFARIYRTDRDSWVVQGLVVTDPEALAQMDIPEGEGCVEIPDRMLPFFGQGDRGIDN